MLMIIAAMIINFVHTRDYDIPEINEAPPSDVVIRDRLHIMGRMSYGEYIVAFLVGAALILLALREPIFMENGWGHILGIESEVTDASVGIVIGMLAFLFPADILPESHQTQIIEWADMLKRLPWGVIFILGSASTITTAMEHNGVFRMLEERLLRLSVPPFYQQYLSMLAMGCVGELTTFKSRLVNFSRIGHKLSRKLRRAPHFFLLPVNVICQLSLILPSASPNNAMAFEMGSMTSLQMIVPGFITKALTIMLYMVLVNYTVTPVDKSELQATTTMNLTAGLEDGPGLADVAIEVAQVAFD
ncbi:solute carrier family 13 member 4-like [Amblyomma americanum]